MKSKNKYQKHARIQPSINGFLGLIGFSSRIPINRYTTLDEMVGNVFLWPYIGILIGVIGAIVAYILAYILKLPMILTATLIYCFLIWFTGFNHIDGVMDMGDGLMVHGDHTKRLSVMRDSMVGTGGISTFFIVAITTIAALASIPIGNLISTVIVIELCAKISMITTMEFGSRDEKGIAHEIKKGMDYKVLVVNIIIALIIAYLLLGANGVIATLATVVFALYIAVVAERNFGCVTGDILGASNEIGRVVALIIILLNISIPLI